MKKLIPFYFLLLVGSISATPELKSYVLQSEHVSIEVVYRYENDILKLYYQSVLDNLNAYTYELKRKGKLTRGKIRFEIMTGAWMEGATGIRMFRYGSGYYCFLNGLLQACDQAYLTKLITYFADDERWESFYYRDSLVSPSTALAIFNKKIESYKAPTHFKSQKLLQLNNIALHFREDALVVDSPKQSYGEITAFIPFSIGTKDFMAIGEVIYVLENNTIINKFEFSQVEVTKMSYENFFLKKHPQWVNFHNYYTYFLSYSVAKNKFYILE